jgi:hypothetical protein
MSAFIENGWRLYGSESNYTSFKSYQKKVKFNDTKLDESIESPFLKDVDSRSNSVDTNQEINDEEINDNQNYEERIDNQNYEERIDNPETLGQVDQALRPLNSKHRIIVYIVLLSILITIAFGFLKYFNII